MRLVLEETIAAPPAIVFDVFTDLHHAAEYVESIQSLQVVGKGPVGKGTRFRETRIMFGKEATEEMEITHFDPPRGYTVTGFSAGAEFNTTYRFEGGSRGTKVTMEMVSQAQSLFAKVVAPIAGVMMKGAMAKAMAQDHAQLRAVAEARAAARAAE